jgi:hypothetical protein
MSNYATDLVARLRAFYDTSGICKEAADAIEQWEVKRAAFKAATEEEGDAYTFGYFDCREQEVEPLHQEIGSANALGQLWKQRAEEAASALDTAVLETLSSKYVQASKIARGAAD